MTKRKAKPSEADLLQYAKDFKAMAEKLEGHSQKEKANYIIDKMGITRDENGKLNPPPITDENKDAWIEMFLIGLKGGLLKEVNVPSSLAHVMLMGKSLDRWKTLWKTAHPDRPDEYDDGEDFDLMPIWREHQRRLFIDHGQGWVFDLKPQQYFDRLIAEGSDEETVITLTEHIFDVERNKKGIWK